MDKIKQQLCLYEMSSLDDLSGFFFFFQNPLSGKLHSRYMQEINLKLKKNNKGNYEEIIIKYQTSGTQNDKMPCFRPLKH